MYYWNLNSDKNVYLNGDKKCTILIIESEPGRTYILHVSRNKNKKTYLIYL